MFARAAQRGDQLWVDRATGRATTDPSTEDLLAYTVFDRRDEGALVVLMVEFAIDGGRDGRVFSFDQDVPLYRPSDPEGVQDPFERLR